MITLTSMQVKHNGMLSCETDCMKTIKSEISTCLSPFVALVNYAMLYAAVRINEHTNIHTYVYIRPYNIVQTCVLKFFAVSCYFCSLF